MKKQIIYSDDFLYDEEAREEYQEWKREEMEDDTYKVSDEEWYDIVTSQLGDERMNLFNHVDGVIIAFARIGTWRGTFNGFKIYDSNINGILHSSCDHNEWYGDGYNIRSTHSHHDGINNVLYRVAKNMESAERIAQLIYDNNINEEQFRKKTKSLYPYVAKIYGWKDGRFHKK